MRHLRKLLILPFSLALVVAFAACAAQQPAAPTAAPTEAPQETAEEEMAEEEMAQDIVAIASGDERFSTLVTALSAADLVETLQGEGPFTVFAPTNDAFAALPEGTVEGLLQDIPALTDVLLYHVVAGEVMAADVVNLDSADTVQGSALPISVEDGKVMVGDAEVVITDIQASNGVIHVINAVLVPAAEEAMAEEEMAEEEMAETIVDIAVADERFSTLVTALTEAGLVETLQGEGPFTVFAPTDDAFAALPEGTVEGLLEDIPALTDVLLYHVVPGNVMAADVVNLDSADTVQGTPLDITVEDGAVMVNDAEVIITDIAASNGVIHVIDAVLVPAAEEAMAEEEMAEEEMTETIVGIAVADERFSTLVTALTEAGLVETLQGEGPFTVFAPTDDAFAALPEGTVEGLLKDIPALTDVLLYHVVAGEVMAADVVNLDSADTVQGTPLDITVEDGAVMVNDAEVIITDIAASNGVIHVIDAVLVPAQ
jgi:uncharacterized surface protein with fasciclin (FAS1) repeats